MKAAAKENDGSWVKLWVTGYVGTAPSFATKVAEPYPLTEEERAQLEAPANTTPNNEEGPGYDD